MVFLLYKKSKKKIVEKKACLDRGSLFSKIVLDLVFILLFKGCILNYTYNINQQTFYFKIEPFTVHFCMQYFYMHYSLLLILLSKGFTVQVFGKHFGKNVERHFKKNSLQI